MPTADSRAAFDLRLRLGQLRERALGRALGDDGDILVECKSSTESRTHVFVEFAENDRPSGIAVTASDWFAVEIAHDRWVMVRTDDLMRFVDRALLRYGERRGGHGNRARGAIVPKVWLLGLEP